MQSILTRYLMKLGEMDRTARVVLSLAFILLMANLDALVSLFLHPELSYFDREHVTVGAITALFSIFVLGGIYRYTATMQEALRERRKAESDLKVAIARAEQEKNKSEAVIAAMGDGICIQDLNYRILYQNQVHKNFVGSHEGEYCYRAYEQQEQVCDQCPVALSFKDGAVHTIERAVQFGDETRYFEITTSPLRDADGKIIAGIEAVRNITKRKLAEQALFENEERYKKLSQEFDALLNAIPDNLTLQSPDLTVLWANRGAAQGLRKELPELIGRRCYDLWHGRSEPCDSCPVTRSFVSGREENDTVTTPDGRIWDLRTFPITDDSGKVVSVIEVGRDITQHRRLERQLVQAQKMEAVGLLAGGIAHDFNNILTAVIGYGSLVLGKLRADDPLRTYVEQVLAASRRAVDLTRGLLAFSRRQIINPLPMEINGIIRRTEQILHRIIGEDIELKTILAERPTTAVVDPGQIEQVFMNLATNARDAMPNGGRLVIGTAIARLDEEYIKAHGYGKKGAYVLVSVTDTGMGMDEQTREHVFEPFFTTKEVGKGTGLGLSIVYGIVKQHSGYVNCYSEPGRGTTFKIYFPMAGEKADIPIVKPEEAAPRGSETVLLAEDDEVVRNLEKTVLEELGYSVIEAQDGEDAVEKLRANRDRIQLLVLDVIMPKMNGKEVYAEALRMRPDIKVLFTSGYTADLVHTRWIIDKGLDFISKPASPQEFLKAVRKALERK